MWRSTQTEVAIEAADDPELSSLYLQARVPSELGRLGPGRRG